ncbi:MAG TPA: hypothetical protein VK810_05680 [Dongiaceae bacterium]|jgi:hypothetical protein|nr:hypothetical protein [Dongiaceae bacterium]
MLIAYVDPGLGMLIWQTVVAAFVGTIFYMNKTRRWIVATIRNIFSRGGKIEPTTTAVTENPATEVETKNDAR